MSVKEKCNMKVELKIVMDIEIDKEAYPNMTLQDVLGGIIVADSDVCDGFEITTSIKGMDNTSDFFLKNAVIQEKRLRFGKQ